MVRCLPDSPLLPTDHRDSPQTVTTSVKPVNTFTTRSRRPLRAMCGRCPDILGQARRIPLDAVADLILTNISLATCATAARSCLLLFAPHDFRACGVKSRGPLPASLQQTERLGTPFRPGEDSKSERYEDHAHAQQDAHGGDLVGRRGTLEQAAPHTGERVGEGADEAGGLKRPGQDCQRVVDAR